MNYAPNPLSIASFAERLSRQQGQMGLAFTLVTAVSLGIVTLRAMQDMMRDKGERSI